MIVPYLELAECQHKPDVSDAGLMYISYYDADVHNSAERKERAHSIFGERVGL